MLQAQINWTKRKIMMEDAMVIYHEGRGTKPIRRLYKINTEGMNSEAASEFAAELKKQMFKKPLVDPFTGEINCEYGPVDIEQNFFLPSPKSEKYKPLSIEKNIYMWTPEFCDGDVQILEGASNLDRLNDYDVIKHDLFKDLWIPKSFLDSRPEEINYIHSSMKNLLIDQMNAKHKKENRILCLIRKLLKRFTIRRSMGS